MMGRIPLGHRRSLLRPRSLRFRVLAIALALAAVGLIVVNVVALLTVRGSLMARIDEQLLAVPAIAATPPLNGADNPIRPNSNQFFSNFVITRLDASTGAVTEQLVGPVQVDAPRPDLSAIVDEIASGGSPASGLVTVGGEGDSGYTYRLRVIPATDGSGEVLTVALSLADLRETITRTARIDAGISIAILLALLAIGIPVMRLGLRPLVEVEATAEEIVSGKLSSRAPHSDDNTEVGSLARSFNAMLERIEGAFAQRDESEEQLRRFVADASHELRTPLTVIRAYAELFRQGAIPASSQAIEAVGRIEDAATRMGSLVDDLLLLARLDQVDQPHQQPALDSAPVDIAGLVLDVVADARASAEGNLITCEVPDSGCATVPGDETRLRQVIANLLRNAVVHTPPGTRIDVEVTAATDAVRLTVSDNGPGMPPEVRDHAFERFFRGDASRGRSVASSGLGLAIVESVVQGHGGSVSVRSTPDDGATFTVVLPTGSARDPGAQRTPRNLQQI